MTGRLATIAPVHNDSSRQKYDIHLNFELRLPRPMSFARPLRHSGQWFELMRDEQDLLLSLFRINGMDLISMMPHQIRCSVAKYFHVASLGEDIGKALQRIYGNSITVKLDDAENDPLQERSPRFRRANIVGYEDMTPAEIIYDFVGVRGDLVGPNARDHLAKALQEAFTREIRKLHSPLTSQNCPTCRDHETGAQVAHPCPTFRAATGMPKLVETPVSELYVDCGYLAAGDYSCRQLARNAVVDPLSGIRYYRCTAHAGLLRDDIRGEVVETVSRPAQPDTN